MRKALLTLILGTMATGTLALAACGSTAAPAPGASASPATAQPAQAAKSAATLTVYSGREEKLIGPLVDQFKKETGIDVKVRYGDTAELAAAILEEGKNSPADVYFAQDAGALGAVSSAGRLAKLPDAVVQRIDERFRSPKGDWVGISGRARTVIYNTRALKPEDLPDSILGFADPKWKGKIGWAPTNGSFQASITALRISQGDAVARQWLEGVKANGAKVYKNNTAIVQAVGTGEVEVGFVNHYYLFGFLKEQGESFPARNYHPRAGDAGAMMNVAGAGILSTSKNTKAAEQFVQFMLSSGSQQYFADQTFEYPLVDGIKVHPTLIPIAQLQLPKIDLGNLSDLEQSLKLLRDAGIL